MATSVETSVGRCAQNIYGISNGQLHCQSVGGPQEQNFQKYFGVTIRK